MALTGVTKTPYGTFRASYKFESKRFYLGTFATELEAHQAYIDYRKENPENLTRPTRKVKSYARTYKPLRKIDNDLRGTWLFGL